MACRNIVNWIKSSPFLRDEYGGVTVEFVVWVVPFMAMLALIVDASILYLTHTEMWNVARDVARRLAIGDITIPQAYDYAEEELFLYGHSYNMTATVGVDVVVSIGTSVADASVFGIFGRFIDGDLVARVVMRREPY